MWMIRNDRRRMRARRPTLFLILTVLVVVLGGCGSGAADSAAPESAETEAVPSAAADEHGDDDTTVAESSEEGADGHASEAFAFGEPATPADADRVVEIRATDEMAFEPATVEVRAGEVITFEVTNVGQIPHDFVLGDEHAQQEHAREMEDMGADMAHVDPNAMRVEPGGTGSITWRFHDAGEVLYGCHQPGHYEAGMEGSVEVTP